MIRITKDNVHDLKIGDYYLYFVLDYERAYKIEDIYMKNETKFIRRTKLYSANGDFGLPEEVAFSSLLNYDYFILDNKEINYYKKLSVFSS